jgi:cytochrome c-type biogenesis protein CcmH
MTLFAMIGGLLVLASLVLLTRPLWRRAPHGARAVTEPAAVSVLRQQLEQLAGLKASGVLGEAQYDEARLALERRISKAVSGAAPPGPAFQPAPRPSRALLLGLAGFVCLIAVGGYAVVGTPRGLDPAAAMAAAAPTGNQHSVTAEQIEAMIEKLAARMKEQPGDADGWAMLGRSYAVLGRFEQAMPAFKQAVMLRGDDAVLLADYADALAVVNGRSLEGEPARLVAQALKLDPDNLKALSLAGTEAFNRKDYAQALVHWEKLARIAPDKELVKQVQVGIDEARRLAGAGATAPTAGAAPAPLSAAAPTTAGATSVSGTVTLAPALAGKAQPGDTLFVFARAVEGPRMPLAILRKQVKDLPLTFTLDDSMAMTPASRLSSVPRLVVGARISKAGDATPRPGDLQGFSAPVAPGATQLGIEIAELVQ